MMSLKKKCENLQMNNSGSALIMVIVVVAFISIMATTLLYVSGSNFYRKTTDLKTKESFYEAETALEEIRAALSVEASEAARAAYTSVSINYAVADSKTRESLFRTEFFKEFEANLPKTEITVDDTTVTVIDVQSFVMNPPGIDYQACISLDLDKDKVGTLDIHTTEGYADLIGVRLQYTDEQGYTTIISTDFRISVPIMNWGVDSARTTWADEIDLSNAETVAKALDRNTVDMADCVSYHNWVKK